jgi:hypothetical protein
MSSDNKKEWQIAIDLLCKTDYNLLGRVARKMMNRLMGCAADEAQALLWRYGRDLRRQGYIDEANAPKNKMTRESLLSLCDDTFTLATHHMDDAEILAFLEKCLRDDKMSLLIKPLLNVHASLTDITDAMQRYQHLKPEGVELSEAASQGMRVALIRRFLTDQLSFIKIAKHYLVPDDFFDLVERLIYATGSHGKLGGKSAGLFLGRRVLKKHRSETPDIGRVKVPKTWYITSEGLHEFVFYNNLEEFYDQKYKRTSEVQQDYPHIVQIFKNSDFPKELLKGLSIALDDFGRVPLIVRSSSLLEDRVGAAFSGKYLSLFLANQGSKARRLEALLDAIAEVYASTFGPDPIEYRAERGLLDFNEQMAIMIQEVVGTRVGQYFFPAFAGVAFSNNEVRWSPRIKREDGLLRIVPGLGTRAVDRLTDDYPVLVSIGKPGLRVNVTKEEIARYATKKMDVINLEKKCFETVKIGTILKAHAKQYPAAQQVFSVLKEDGVTRSPVSVMTDFENDDIIASFDGLIDDSDFVAQIEAITKTLSQALGTPADIEFACNGSHLYLLQCRAQSYTRDEAPAEIPEDIPEVDILFTANRHVSNGRIRQLTHIVYVDPSKYSTLPTHDALTAVGKTVGKLNKILPRRRFVLIGPGRWGSRGDIKLGVHVSYADINNTAMLIEIGRSAGEFALGLSFGTHFFQDLVEASIRYLPLYPDMEGMKFNEAFLRDSTNLLQALVPDSADLEEIIRVIDIPRSTEGKILDVLMNAETNEAVGLLRRPERDLERPAKARHS